MNEPLSRYTGITVSQLIEQLKQWPSDAQVFFQDGNFGGPSDELTLSKIKFDGRSVLIDSPYWQPVED